MTSFFRSEEMTQCQLFLQSEAAYACVTELGELGLVQFKDLNPDVNAFQRKFVNEIRRCEEMERKLRYMEKEMKKDDMKIPDHGENPKAPAPKEMIDLEATFEKMESELREVNTNAEALKRNKLELTELREVLKKTQNFFAEQGAGHHTLIEDAQQALVHDDMTTTQSVQLGFVAGVILREKVPSFERLLWFACRGNVFVKFEEIEIALQDPVTGDDVHKCVFIVFFQGEQLKSRVKKICEGYKATLYPCPESVQERQDMLSGVHTRLEDLKMVLTQTEEHRVRVLKSAQKEMRIWIIKVRKIKAIYHTLNMCNFDVSHNSLIAECWCPVFALDQVQMSLQHGTEISGSTVPSILHRMKTKETPPTYNHTNKLTKAWQNIVNSYGISDYRECNPAPFSIISFPFLFAVMFGDAGHGFIMFLFGLWMVMSEKKLAAMKSGNEIFNTFFGGRYLITLMGLFSVYTGLLYNDVFAKSVNIFGSRWNPDYPEDELQGESLILNPAEYYDNKTGPYYFGMDPIWMLSSNKISFSNSFKMKLSVILGISQMMFGVWISLFNHIHFKSVLNVLVQFIPEVIFMLSIFGYLVALVFYKWVTYDNTQSGCAPSLLIHFINMFLFKYQEAKEGECNYQAVFYPGQQYIQICLILAAVVCIPILLFVKPFVVRSQYRSRVKRKSVLSSISTEGLVRNEVEPDTADTSVSTKEINVDVENGAVHAQQHGDDDEEEFDFGEIFIHQAIHTIEYCLGCVSHTASYLRLWALSLAHAQLSEVLWTMVFHIALSMKMKYIGGILIWAIWSAWAVLTIAVLLVMEGLSAFLHTLRLHWVEFQSKFYHGTGYLFVPFNFKDLLDVSLDDVKL